MIVSKLAACAVLFTTCLVQCQPAQCECGYSVNTTSDSSFAVYTELLESDFTSVRSIHKDTDWIIQGWGFSGPANQGPLGRQYNISNIVSNPAKNILKSIDGINGDQAGLELYVRSEIFSESGIQYVGGAEIDTTRTDMLYGTFRAGIKQTGVNGTCGAFFWYYSDTQEIDIEFLSSQIGQNSSSINLVLHTALSLARGNDASQTPTYKVIQLPFASDTQVHEYRFDWSPDKVSFFIDGNWVWKTNESQYIPTMPGHLVLNHWSNGNPLWSGGPPDVDARMLVTYTKAYFNSSKPERLVEFNKRCGLAKNKTVCQIPDQLGPPVYGDSPGIRPYFFSQDRNRNAVVDQTVYEDVATTLFDSVDTILVIYSILLFVLL